MKDLAHIQFQALSSCEAMQAHQAIGEAILQAYETGMNVVLQNYNAPIEDLVRANHEALVALGFADHEDLVASLVRSLHFTIRKEGEKC